MAKKPSSVKTAEDVYRLMKRLGRLRRERVYSILLDGENQVIGCEEISRGSDLLADGHPDLVFRSARLRDCSSMILVHNHPSGHVEPSFEDKLTTRKLYEDGKKLGIELADSIIIGKDSYYSFREAGLWMNGRGRNKKPEK